MSKLPYNFCIYLLTKEIVNFAFCIKKDNGPRASSGKVTKIEENITYKRAKRSALSHKVTSRLQETDMTVWQRQIQLTNKLRFRTVNEGLVHGINLTVNVYVDLLVFTYIDRMW